MNDNNEKIRLYNLLRSGVISFLSGALEGQLKDAPESVKFGNIVFCGSVAACYYGKELGYSRRPRDLDLIIFIPTHLRAKEYNPEFSDFLFQKVADNISVDSLLLLQKYSRLKSFVKERTGHNYWASNIHINFDCDAAEKLLTLHENSDFYTAREKRFILESFSQPQEKVKINLRIDSNYKNHDVTGLKQIQAPNFKFELVRKIYICNLPKRFRPTDIIDSYYLFKYLQRSGVTEEDILHEMKVSSSFGSLAWKKDIYINLRNNDLESAIRGRTVNFEHLPPDCHLSLVNTSKALKDIGVIGDVLSEHQAREALSIVTDLSKKLFKQKLFPDSQISLFSSNKLEMKSYIYNELKLT